MIRKKSPIIISVVLCVVTVFMLIYFVSAIKETVHYFDNESRSIAQSYTLKNSKLVEKGIKTSIYNVKNLAQEVTDISDAEHMDQVGEGLAQKYHLTCLQFLQDGEVLLRYGDSAGPFNMTELGASISSSTFGYSRIFTDNSIGKNCVAVFVPVENNTLLNGLVAYISVEQLLSADLSNDALLRYYCIAQADGSIIKSNTAHGFKTDVSHNIFTALYNLSGNKSAVDEIQKRTVGGINDAYRLQIQSTDYVVACMASELLGRDCVLYNIYRKSDIQQSKYSLYNRMLGASVGIVLLASLIIIIYAATVHNNRLHMLLLDEVDPMLGCNTYNRFVREAEEKLTTNRFSSYAVLYMDINKFSYIRSNFDSDATDASIRYISNIVQKMVTQNETYGHISDDRFVALLHFSDMNELGDRIKIIAALVHNFELAKQHNFSLVIAVGVYVVERDKNFTIQEMVNRSIIAQKSNKKDLASPFVVYDGSIRDSYLLEAEMESKMETALKSHSFKVFFQPKYNIEKNQIDGAEALVRWYDTERRTYTPPDDFVPFFEVNGFIAKLDLYVFNRVCRYLSESIERGERVVPISINVSRVTAIQPEFLSNYIAIKRKYGIADGLLMLEFTESFAFQNYERISEIVTVLKANGFKCSIDDFGAGYSSFGILKELRMDELKLDKFFLTPGKDPFKDQILIQTMINLGKSFNMKVTQEGVETAEQLNLLKSYGCDVVQGFYYSKPMQLSDFIAFLNSDTSLTAIIRNHIENKHTSNDFATVEH